MEEWKGTKVVCFGDLWDSKKNNNPYLDAIAEDIDDIPWEYALDHFENVGVYFKQASKEEFYGEYRISLESGQEYYGPDLSDPRCFTRDVEFVKYVINHSKHEFYDRFTKHFNDDYRISRWFDPTAMLLVAGMGYDSPMFGTWIGDDVEASNDDDYVLGLGYKDYTQKYDYEYFFPSL